MAEVMWSRPNVVFLVVDALCFKSLERTIGGKPIMPFLNSWRAAGRSWDKVFSLAPYTEAALVSLLGGERTLENGGYLFGNALCKAPFMDRFSQNGYRTLLGYSPYVFSEGYLSGVDDFYYARLYSIGPLFTYRLDHYAEIAEKRALRPDEMKTCRLLIEEGLRCWQRQLEALREDARSVDLIKDRVSRETALAVLESLQEHIERFEADPDEFIMKILKEGKTHDLLRLNTIYNAEAELPLIDLLRERYSAVLKVRRKSLFTKLREQPPSLRYVASTFVNDGEDHRGTRGLLHNYRHLYEDDELADYLDGFHGDTKVEVSAKRQLRFVLEELARREADNAPLFVYVQVQDFHLPSVFHTFDSSSEDELDKEMKEAIALLDDIDSDHTGSTLADLSAHYCDSKIQEFYEELQGVSKECMVVVTADHGYPSYFDPPRPMIYNQTYVEAFHVPFFILGGEVSNELIALQDKVVSQLDLVDAFDRFVLGEGLQDIPTGFVISEYAGPGCPDLSDKPIWYTYIDQNHRISARCPLSKSFDKENIDTVIDLRNDPDELINIRKRALGQEETLCKVARIAERHEQLRAKHASGDYLSRSCASAESTRD